jgi:hypothetical protein
MTRIILASLGFQVRTPRHRGSMGLRTFFA